MRIGILCVALVLGGCAPVAGPTPVVTTTPAESLPADGIEELALAAVNRYFAVSTEVAADGGANPDRIAEAVTDSWLPEELSGFDALRALGASQVGSPTVTKMEVAAVRGIAAVTEVVVYACTTTDGVTIRTDDTETDAPAGLSLVTVYVVPENGELQVDGVEPWTDVSWCAEQS